MTSWNADDVAGRDNWSMPFVATAPGIDCRHTTCVDVRPMDGFGAGPNFPAAGG